MGSSRKSFPPITSTVQISRSYLTIDGSTAPSPGITLSIPGQRIALEASGGVAVHDVIVNNIRTVGSGGDIEVKDHWELDGSSGAPIYNVILDHLTMARSSDGSVDMFGDVHDVTLSNSLLRDSIKSQHYSQPGGTRNAITVYRNVYARNNERQPKIRYNTTRVEFINNVIYGWGWFEGGATGIYLQVGGSAYSPSGNIENNVVHHVSGLSGSADQGLVVDSSPLVGDWYFSGNEWPVGEDDAISTSGQVVIPAIAQVGEVIFTTVAAGEFGGIAVEHTRPPDVVQCDIGQGQVFLQERTAAAPFREPVAENQRVVTEAHRVL